MLSVNPNLLVVVGGLNFQTDLKGVYTRPIRLSKAGRLVYAPHSYKQFFTKEQLGSWDRFYGELGNKWGYILAQGKPYTAPLWVSEFGTCLTWKADACTQDDANFSNGIQKYLRLGDFEWAYWMLNGTQSEGTGRQHGALDWYGLLDMSWNGPSNAANVGRIKALQPITQWP